VHLYFYRPYYVLQKVWKCMYLGTWVGNMVRPWNFDVAILSEVEHVL
jgi:hypothetical protein